MTRIDDAMLSRNRRLATRIEAGTDVATLDEVIEGVQNMGRANIDVPGPRAVQLVEEIARLRRVELAALRLLSIGGALLQQRLPTATGELNAAIGIAPIEPAAPAKYSVVPYVDLPAIYAQNPDSSCWAVTHVGRPCGPDCLAFTLDPVDQADSYSEQSRAAIVALIRRQAAELDDLRKIRTRAVDMFADEARPSAVHEAAREVLWGRRPDNGSYVRSDEKGQVEP